MKSEEWKSYRTRFLVNAKQLTSTLSFIDHLGRQHSGRKGDYLVESSDGVLSIAPRRIFEDIYIAMPQQPNSANCESSAQINLAHVEALEIEEIRLQKNPLRRKSDVQGVVTAACDSGTRLQRKLPQPCRDRRGSIDHARIM